MIRIFVDSLAETKTVKRAFSIASINDVTVDEKNLTIDIEGEEQEKTIYCTEGNVSHVCNGILQVDARIEMVEMGKDDPDPIPAKSRGTVTKIIHSCHNDINVEVKWDSGRELSVVIPPDKIICHKPIAQSENNINQQESSIG